MGRYIIYKVLLVSFLLISVIFLHGCRNTEEKITETEKTSSLPQPDYSVEYADEISSTPDISTSAEEEKSSEETTVILRFAGDTTMSDFFGDALEWYGYDYMFEDVSGLTKGADFTFLNLETSVSVRGSSTKPEGFGFRSYPGHLQGFVNAGIDLVSLANNHVLDYGKEAFFDTMMHLEEYGIAHVGAGMNIDEASMVKYFDVKGIKIGFIGASSIIPWSSWKASEDSPGIMPLDNDHIDIIYKRIIEAKENCDFLIACFHWGQEYVPVHLESQQILAEKLIDMGVDIIAGSHPHVLQGIQYYNGGLIFYSTGNFVFYKNNHDSGLTGLFEVVINSEKIVSAKIYPVFINNLKANLLEPDDPYYSDIIENLNQRSQGLGTFTDQKGNILFEN